MAMAIIEKIFARASGAKKVTPGDFVVVKVDTMVLHDFAVRSLMAHEIVKLHDPDRVVVIYDHSVPAPDAAMAAAHDEGRKLVRRFGIKRFHDVGADQGITHVICCDQAYALPGSVLVNGDSHACAVGAMNCAGRGVGWMDMAYVLTTGNAWFRVGETIRYDLAGQLSQGVSAKDVILYMAGAYGSHTNQNIEFGGPALSNLNLNARRTMSVMSAELSVEFATFEPDQILIDYVTAKTRAPFEPQYPDHDAQYAARRSINLSEMEPQVALPDAVVKNTVPVSSVASETIQQAFIGSCANGSLDDIAEAARILRGKRVAAGVRLIVTPGSQQIFMAALRAGYVQTLMDAGAVVTPATCGACMGGHMGVVGPGETCITASTRNFKGRMGDPSARIFLASPSTVAASAVAGRIAHPASVTP